MKHVFTFLLLISISLTNTMENDLIQLKTEPSTFQPKIDKYIENVIVKANRSIKKSEDGKEILYELPLIKDEDLELGWEFRQNKKTSVKTCKFIYKVPSNPSNNFDETHDTFPEFFDSIARQHDQQQNEKN